MEVMMSVQVILFSCVHYKELNCLKMFLGYTRVYTDIHWL